MRDFPSCFGENGVQVADSSASSNGSKAAQNVVTCVYQCRLRSRPCLVTVTWSKSLIGQALTVGIDDVSSSNHCLCKVDIKPWLFSKRKGSKTLEAYSTKIDLHWDFSPAKFGSGPEPIEGYYVALAADRRVVLLLGDLQKEALKKTAAQSHNHPVMVAKKEHVYGKKVFSTKARFCGAGPAHDLSIECCDEAGPGSDPGLVIRVDGKSLLQVKRLRWKFRGNHTILVDGVAVEVFWDVHGWLFGAPSPSSSSSSGAVFMFKTCLSAEKLWSTTTDDPTSVPWSFTQRISDSKASGLGLSFSLILYAWKSE